MADTLNTPQTDSSRTSLNPNFPASVNKKIIDAGVQQQKIEKEGKKEERGLLGQFWGSIEHSSNNIAGLFILLLLIIASVYTFSMLCCKPDGYHEKILDFWGIITPLLTLALGYLFGKSPSN